MTEAADKALSPRGPLGLGALVILATLALGLFVGLIALGTWQVERRAWKLDLLERVDKRIHAPAVPLPEAATWSPEQAERDEYRRVTLTGRFLHDKEVLVQASTTLGGGFWVVTPMRLSTGEHVLVNRGFVPPERRDPSVRNDSAMRDPGDTTVTGLLRRSQTGGGFLRENAPSEGRWHSRDVSAIAAAQGVSHAAPFFIDADAGPAGVWPVGGLTVTRFNNHHTVYALTWYALAIMLAGASYMLARREWRLRQGLVDDDALTP